MSVEPTDPDPTGPSLELFREQNAVDYDLTSPPTAQQLGVPEGRDTAIFDRDGSEFWDVSFQLPGGSTFTTSQAIAVGIFIENRPGGLLNSVGINVNADSEEELADLLARDVDQLGLDPAQVERFLADYRRSGSNTTNVVLHGQDFGYLSTSVDARPATGEPGKLALNYDFTWEPGGAEAPS